MSINENNLTPIIMDYPQLNSTLNLSMNTTDDIMTKLLTYLELPSENIVADLDERKRSFRNLEDVISEIVVDKKTMSYLSKYIYATSVGLFDASLNYLWDATINELRKRVINFDISYFYDVAVTNTEKRSKLYGPEDITKITDSDLLQGAKKIEMIDEISFKKLEHIKFMRNSTSTAHPNEYALTGLELINWLEVCIKSVFNLPLSELNLEIKKLLLDVKGGLLPDGEIDAKKFLFGKVTAEQQNSLLNGLFGIFISDDATTDVKKNITRLIPTLWSLAAEDTKTKIGTNYGNYMINSHTKKAENAKKFIEIVNGQAYIPVDLQISEINNILSDLTTAHNGSNNFYTEQVFAEQLYKFVGEHSVLPNSIEKNYVLTVVNCFLTNSHGVAWDAEGYYKKMIESFTDKQASIALMSFKDKDIKDKLDTHKICSQKFVELLRLISSQFIQGIELNLLNFIINFKGEPIGKFVNDTIYLKTYNDFVENF